MELKILLPSLDRCISENQGRCRGEAEGLRPGGLCAGTFFERRPRIDGGGI